MIVDFRQYTLKTGAVQTFLEMFQNEGRELIVGQEVRLLVAAPCNPRIEGVKA